MSKQKLTTFAIAAALLMGGAWAAEATAASPFGRTGLGPNLHRRFVLKQAVKNANSGRSVRNSAILWNARPYSSSMNRSRGVWRRW